MTTIREPALDREDFEFLMDTARRALEQRLPNFVHLDQPIGAWNYIRIANEIADRVGGGRLLDWGCGFGQMTYLLRRRGFDVTAFDIGEVNNTLPDLPLCNDLNIVRTTHPTRLPFADASFDIVLSCGVLEHVDEFSEPGNEIESLQEIRRVLTRGGYFPIYQLPQRYTWQEAVMRRLKNGYTHQRLFTATEIRAMLRNNGYDVLSLSRSNLLPKNLSGLPQAVRGLYSRFSRPLIGLDKLLCRVPLLNQTAGVLEVWARRA